MKFVLLDKKRKILNGIRKGDPKILNQLYNNFFPEVKLFIITHGGTIEDAKEVFQIALTAVFEQSRDEDFNITTTFKTYFISICKHKWFNELRRRNVRDELSLEDVFPSELDDVYDDDLIEIFEDAEKTQIYLRHLNNLSCECKEILIMFYDKIPMKEIAKHFGLRDVKYARKKKYRCKDFLIRSIMEDPKYNEIMFVRQMR